MFNRHWWIYTDSLCMNNYQLHNILYIERLSLLSFYRIFLYSIIDTIFRVIIDTLFRVSRILCILIDAYSLDIFVLNKIY